MIAGLEEISSGELWIDGVLSNYLEPGERGLSMVFQNYALYPYMTVYENMAFGLRVHKMEKAGIDKRVREAGPGSGGAFTDRPSVRPETGGSVRRTEAESCHWKCSGEKTEIIFDG